MNCPLKPKCKSGVWLLNNKVVVKSQSLIDTCLFCEYGDECRWEGENQGTKMLQVISRDTVCSKVEDSYVQCEKCLAVEELTFSDGVLEGVKINGCIHSGRWKQRIQGRDGKIIHDCLL